MPRTKTLETQLQEALSEGDAFAAQKSPSQQKLRWIGNKIETLTKLQAREDDERRDKVMAELTTAKETIRLLEQKLADQQAIHEAELLLIQESGAAELAGKVEEAVRQFKLKSAAKLTQRTDDLNSKIAALQAYADLWHAHQEELKRMPVEQLDAADKRYAQLKERAARADLHKRIYEPCDSFILEYFKLKDMDVALPPEVLQLAKQQLEDEEALRDFAIERVAHDAAAAAKAKELEEAAQKQEKEAEAIRLKQQDIVEANRKQQAADELASSRADAEDMNRDWERRMNDQTFKW